MTRKATLTLISLFAILLICGIGAAFYLDRLLHLDTYKDQIIANIEGSLKREVRYAKGDFSFRFGPSFTFDDVIIKEKDSTVNFITAKRLTFKLALFPLLERKLVLHKMLFDHPVLQLTRDRSGQFNISDLLEEKKETLPLQVKGIQLIKGVIRFTDQAVAQENVITVLEETDLTINQLVRGKQSAFKINSRVAGEGKRSLFAIVGDANLAKENEPLSATTLNVKVHLNGINAGHYWPYYNRYVPFKKILGYFDLEGTLKGKLTEFKSKGSARVIGLRFNYPQVFHAVLAPKDLSLAYDLNLTPREISINSIHLKVDGVNVTGGCAIRDIGSGDPRIVANAVTSPIRLEDFGGYIPYGIIVKDPADFIEQHIKGGIYRLDEGRLDGRVSQILHMERGDNYNVLYIRGRVENGIVSYGSKVPTFNAVKGGLEMRGKDFSLIHMAGNFGTSPMTLEGKITDYPLDSPSGYPFTMNILPRQPEVAWLLGKERGDKLLFWGESTLHLTGNGYTSGYNLAGEWNLNTAAYNYTDFISKPVGRNNTISFKGSINKQEARLSELIYSLNPLSLNLAATYRFNGKNPLSLDVRTNQFSIGEIGALFPSYKKYQLSGKVQGDIHGKGDLDNFSAINWGGDLNFNGFAVKPGDTIKNFSNINGTVRFHGDTLETSQIAAKVGTSTIYAKGTMSGFTNPVLNITFSSPSLDMADLGFRPTKKQLKVDKLQGTVSLQENNLQIKSLTGQMDNSTINVKGTVIDIKNPRVDITVTSPYLELDDLLAFKDLEQDDNKKSTPRRVILKASLQAASGKIKETSFKKLKTTVVYEDKILYLQPLELFAFDGEIAGKVRIDMGVNNTAPRYQVSWTMDKVSAEKVAQMLGVKKQEITGKLSLQGEVTAKGESSLDIRKTALGSVKLRIEKGSMRRFSVLSKVFSILNVSQLLKFQLPDMVSGGMPYNRITGAISIHDGIVSTSDLFIDSEAINISAVGKLDMVKEELDVTLGVQPLQTVDKVVSRLPIVGWILTGSDKSLITTYFEAKGKVENPTVTAVPVKSLAKGVLNIFKRVFELPGKLITDTGEVILGK